MHCLPTLPSTHFDCEMHIFETIFLLSLYFFPVGVVLVFLILMAVFMIWIIFFSLKKKIDTNFYLLPDQYKNKLKRNPFRFGQKCRIKTDDWIWEWMWVCMCIFAPEYPKRIWEFNWEFFSWFFLLSAILLPFIYRSSLV